MTGTLASLIPAPLHPAIVHLPMALAVLVPLFAVGAVVAIRRGVRPMRAWAVALAMFAALSASSWVSLETGEQQEDRVESAVPRAALHGHAEAAEVFLTLSGCVLLVAGVGLLSTRAGSVARGLATVGSVALLVAGYEVGHTGGALVYSYGAANAYVKGAVAEGAGSGAAPTAARGSAEAIVADDDDDDDDAGNGSGAARASAAPVTGAAAATPLPSHLAVPLSDSTRP
jgi:uncharacterized membrane protein